MNLGNVRNDRNDRSVSALKDNGFRRFCRFRRFRDSYLALLYGMKLGNGENTETVPAVSEIHTC